MRWNTISSASTCLTQYASKGTQSNCWLSLCYLRIVYDRSLAVQAYYVPFRPFFAFVSNISSAIVLFRIGPLACYLSPSSPLPSYIPSPFVRGVDDIPGERRENNDLKQMTVEWTRNSSQGTSSEGNGY